MRRIIKVLLVDVLHGQLELAESRSLLVVVLGQLVCAPLNVLIRILPVVAGAQKLWQVVIVLLLRHEVAVDGLEVLVSALA